MNDHLCNSEMQLLHDLELKIAIEINRICEKNDIQYFLTAGTALGAVRHGGFIPWDDDMDMGMLRNEYNHFLDACKTDLGPEFFLQTWDTDDGYPFPYAKVRLKNTHFKEAFSSEGTSQNGIFVDIAPFDSVPTKPRQRKQQKTILFFCKRLMWIKKGYGRNMRGLKKVKYYIFLCFSHLFNYDSVKQYYEKRMVKYNDEITPKIVTEGSYGYEKEALERRWTENLTQILFEGVSFPVFRDTKEYLTYFYGDYMKLPPLDKRDQHQLLDVDFGPYAQ